MPFAPSLAGGWALTSNLGKLEIFAGLGEEDLAELAASSREARLGAEEQVYRQGSEAVALYVVDEGEVVLVRDAVGKPVILVARLGPGEPFGELGLLEGKPVQETARTTRPTRLTLLPREPLLAFLEARPMVRLQLRRAAVDATRRRLAASADLATRKEVRVRIDRGVTLLLATGERLRVRLENLSLGGASISGVPDSWERGKPVAFRLLDDAGRVLLDVRGKVAWKRGGAVGLAFEADRAELTSRVPSAIQALLPRRGVPKEVSESSS